jgi:hypothetical protein
VSRATDRLVAARQLLDGAPVLNLRELLGTEPSGGLLALALRPRAAAGTAESDGDEPDLLGRTAQFATVYFDAYRVPALVAPVTGATVDIVVGLGPRSPATRARELLDELCERVHATFGIELLGAVGDVAADVRGLPGSKRDALAVLEVLAADEGEGPRTASYTEVQSLVAFRELLRSMEGTEHLNRGPIPSLVGSSSKQDRALVATARAYLEAAGDVGRAADALGVHRNTVRYRVTRFEAVTGLDLTDPSSRLVAQLQLSLGSARLSPGGTT